VTPTDVVAAPVISGLGVASGNLTLTSDKAGNLYLVLTGSATPPTAAQIIAGNDHTDAAADFNTTYVLEVGENSDAPFTGAPDGTFYLHVVVNNGASSNVLTLGETIVFGAAADMVKTFYGDYQGDSYETTHTANSASTSAAASPLPATLGAGRWVIFVGSRIAACSGVTIDGITATEIVPATAADSGADEFIRAYYADIAGGGTGNIVATFGVISPAKISAFKVTDAGSATVVSDVVIQAGGAPTANLVFNKDTVANEVGMLMWMQNKPGTTTYVGYAAETVFLDLNGRAFGVGSANLNAGTNTDLSLSTTKSYATAIGFAVHLEVL
jgi:hypothetical protein